jgi:very-short-patch-repair endonuclease
LAGINQPGSDPVAPKSPVVLVSELAAHADGAFRGADAVRAGVTRNQLGHLRAQGIIERALPDTYTLTAVQPSDVQRLQAALLWAGHGAAADGRSAGHVYGLEGVRARRPEIVTDRQHSPRHPEVATFTTRDPASLMLRTHLGVRVTGPEATLVRLANLLDDEAFEIACEDARRRRLTSVPALRAYLERFGRSGRDGVGPLRVLLDQLDPRHPARSTLEVKTRRLLAANHVTGFVRERPLTWDGRKYHYDFGFDERRVIVETNGRRWHDDPTDFEGDHEKWSVPGRHGYKLVLATWDKVVRHPEDFIHELRATLAA